MPSPGLPVTIDNDYADSGTDSSVGDHQRYHDTVHGAVNKFDTAIGAAAGYVLIGNGAVFVARTFVSTDNPGVIINTQAASYTLVLADAGKLILMNVTSANNLTVPPDSSVTFPIGTVISGLQYNTGATRLVAGTGVGLYSRGGLLSTAGRYAPFSLTKLAANEWIVAGDLA